jgi:hypothetical protein
MTRSKKVADSVTIIASGARTAATGTGDAVYLPRDMGSLTLELDVTAAATDAGDKLDVYVQTKVGANYVDIHRFTQVLGNGGTKRFYAKIEPSTGMSEFENGTGLAAAASRDIFGDAYRVRWVITDAGTDDASFTFSVVGAPSLFNRAD